MHRALSSSGYYSLSLIYTLLILWSSFLAVVNGSPAGVGLSSHHHARQISPTNTNSPLNPLDPASSQASFTDGGGVGFSAPSVLWIVFSCFLGLPLAVAGVRGWRITSGVGVGLSLSILIWSAFVNSTTGASLAANPITSDLLLSLFIWGCFFVGVGLGSLRHGIFVGVSLLGASAGVALGILMALLRPGLLIPIYALNIVPMGIFGVAGALWPLWQQRLAVIVSTSTCGAFFIALAVDLILNKQNGMSLGLRFLLDRNKVHLGATLRVGYKPTLSTIIIIGAAMALIPVFSLLQHRLFRQPFDRTPESLDAYNRATKGTPILGPGDEGYADEKEQNLDNKPSHVRMRFPSIIPSLPTGRIDPQYPQQRMQPQDMGMGPNVPPTPGIGRRNFIGVAVNAAKRISTTAAKRMSTSLGIGAWRGNEKRASNWSLPSIYSVATMDRTPVGPSGSGSPGFQGGMKIPQTRPLQLPNRQPPSSVPTSYAPPSSYAQSTRSGPSTRVAQPPPASLRSGRGAWDNNNSPRNDYGGGSRGNYNTPPRTPNSAQRNVAPAPSTRSNGSGGRLKSAGRYNNML